MHIVHMYDNGSMRVGIVYILFIYNEETLQNDFLNLDFW